MKLKFSDGNLGLSERVLIFSDFVLVCSEILYFSDEKNDISVETSYFRKIEKFSNEILVFLM